MLIGPQISPASIALATRLRELRSAIASAATSVGRTEESITLVAVSKGHDAETIRTAAALGIVDFGESYLQEALPKLQALGLPVRWHFIGRVQANKTQAIAAHFDWVHGIDRLQIAERLSSQRPSDRPPLQVCIQVNIAGESAKAGVAPAQLPGLATAVASLPRLQLRGLMCILPAGQDSQHNRGWFAALRRLLGQLDAGAGRLDTLSMGMSSDFRDAVLEGATLLRIGTALFGPRPRRQVSTPADPGLG
jgi:pyridoxal phosphate enzyme (YggS family)